MRHSRIKSILNKQFWTDFLPGASDAILIKFMEWNVTAWAIPILVIEDLWLLQKKNIMIM